MHCSCESEELWDFLRDHPKWVPSNSNEQLHCEQPTTLRGQMFTKIELHKFCDLPLIPKLAIQDIQPYSVVVSWQSRKHLSLRGYEIVYHVESDNIKEVKTKNFLKQSIN